MKNLMERFFKEAPTDELMVNERQNKSKKKRSEGLSRKQFRSVCNFNIAAVLLCLYDFGHIYHWYWCSYGFF